MTISARPRTAWLSFARVSGPVEVVSAAGATLAEELALELLVGTLEDDGVEEEDGVQVVLGVQLDDDDHSELLDQVVLGSGVQVVVGVLVVFGFLLEVVVGATHSEVVGATHFEDEVVGAGSSPSSV